MTILQSGIARPSSGYDIDQSLRFEDGDSAYLSRTPGSAGNLKTWTLSFWRKQESGSTTEPIMTCGSYSGGITTVYFTSSGRLAIADYSSGAYNVKINSEALYRDPSAWSHYMVVWDTSNAASTDRVRIFKDGSRVTDINSGGNTFPSLNFDGEINSAALHMIGRDGSASSDYGRGYIAEVHFLDGTSLTDASSFGETDAATNQWKPTEVTGLTYGTNGFYQKYSATELANSFTDSRSTGTPHTLTAVGNVTNTRAQSKFSSSSVYSYDWSDNINCSPHVLLPTEFTWEGWVRFENATPGETAFFNLWDGSVIGGHDNRSYRIWYQTNTLGVAVSSDGDNPNSNERFFSWTPSQNTWYYISVGRDSSYDCRAFVDGTQVGVTQSLSRDAFTPETSATEQYLAGQNGVWYQDVQFSTTNRYTTTYSIPTASVIPDSDTVFLVNSDFDGGLGADSSGNKNDFAATNLVATDQMIDTPTLNYCTMNPLDAKGTVSASEGNLKVTTTSGNPEMRGTIAIPSTGKWYWEFLNQTSVSMMIGVADQRTSGSAYGSSEAVLYSSGLGTKYNFSSVASYGSTWTTSDLMGIAFNRDDNEITFYKNNVAQPTLTIGGTADQRSELIPVINTGTGGTGGGTFNFGQDSSFAGSVTAQGNGGDGEDFYYTPPSGYIALNTDNLSDPAIALPTDHFNTKLYVGNGSTQSITGVGFQPDFTWLKERNNGTNYSHQLYDVVRGATNYLTSNTTAAENDGGASCSTCLTSFDSDGFSLGSNAGINANTINHVAWNWKAGGTAVSNTDGTITSSVSANTTAGFSVVSYTGSGATATVGHGLSVAPDLIIIKNRDTVVGWPVYAEPLGNAKRLELDDPYQEQATSLWNSTSPTASVFTIINDDKAGTLNDKYIAYAFHSVEGYSKVGTYEGNNNSDGTFIYTGFKPAFLIYKSMDTAYDWGMVDNKRSPNNVLTKYLAANESAAEITNSFGDFTSNGIKMRNTYGGANAANTYMYIAFAESPFKTSNAR